MATGVLSDQQLRAGRILVAHRRRRRGVAVLAATCALTGMVGGLAPPAGASNAARTTAVHGTVTLDGHALANVPVGTWSPSAGTLATSLTNARGEFTLHSESGIPVYAYAGASPDKSRAVFTLATLHLVRGVIGAYAAAHVPYVLYEGAAPAMPSKLGGGHALEFRLQRAGRFSGKSSHLGASGEETGSILVQRGNAVYGAPYSAKADGSFTSPYLVPGRYRLFWDPRPDVLPARSWVTVRSGETSHATTPRFHRGARITVDVVQSALGPHPGAPVSDLPILVTQPGRHGARDSAGTTGTSGQVVLKDEASGSYTVTAGTYYVDPDEGLQSPNGQLTSDNWLPAHASVTVGASHADRTLTIAVDPAAHLTGSVASAAAFGDLRQVVAENSAGVPVRSAYLESGASSFDLGGLTGGTYTVTAIDTPNNGRGGVYSVSHPAPVSAGGTSKVSGTLRPATTKPTLSGTVRGSKSGDVIVSRPYVYGTTAGVSTTGHYRLSIIPGRFRARVLIPGHVDSPSVSVTVSKADTTKKLVPGAAYAAAAARFTVNGHPVEVAVGATDGISSDDFTLEPTATIGRSTAHYLVPGHYRWTGTPFTVPASDGPWYYSTPTGAFTLNEGVTTNLGTKDLTIRR